MITASPSGAGQDGDLRPKALSSEYISSVERVLAGAAQNQGFCTAYVDHGELGGAFG